MGKTKREPPANPRCHKCQGTVRAETAIDLQSGLLIVQYVCFNCGRRWHPDTEPRPLTAA